MNEIKKTTLHPDSQPNVDLYPKTSADQIESLDARIRALSSHIYKVSIDLPKGAKNGNITQSQLDILQASEFNCIEMKNDNEIYYLNDPGHEEGFLTYSHVGIENGKTTIKTLTITVSAKSFVIVTTVVPTDAGEKLYSYKFNDQSLMTYGTEFGSPLAYVNIQFYLPYLTEINTYEKLRAVCEKIYEDSAFPITFRAIYSSTYYSGTLCFYKSGEDNYVRLFFGGITSNASGSGLTDLQYFSVDNALRPSQDNSKKQWSDAITPIVTEL